MDAVVYKRILIRKVVLWFVLVWLLAAGAAIAQEQIMVSVFIREGCEHCHEEQSYLNELAGRGEGVRVKYYDLSKQENLDLFNQITDRYSLSKGTPLTLARGLLITGFSSADTTGKMIAEVVGKDGPAGAVFEDIAAGGAKVLDASGAVCDEVGCKVVTDKFLIDVPVINKTLDVGKLSLASMSLVLGLVDGFNPCAMWVLVMFLVLLSHAGSRRRMWQYAGLFIVAEAIMYYLILDAWFAVWDFIALNKIVTPLVGLLALGSGAYFIYKFMTFKQVCAVTSLDKQQKVETRVQELVKKPLTLAVAIGIIGLALSVNIFEFACSIGIPQAFTKVLELNALSWIKTQWYMALYIFAYMLDDILVFALALWGFEKISIAHKYSKWATLLGGVLMILLGLIMLLRPQWLVL